MFKKLFAFMVALVPFLDAMARPVSFKGGVGVMPTISADRKEVEVNYSFRPDMAVGAHSIHLDDGKRKVDFVFSHLNYRLFRRNEMDSQTNFYPLGGIGGAEDRGKGGEAAYGGLQFDYETRRIYTLFSGERLEREEGGDYNSLRHRLGCAPYVADFESVHTWIIGQVDYSPDTADTLTVTPMIRVFYQTYMVELGVRNDGELFMAGIFHF